MGIQHILEGICKQQISLKENLKKRINIHTIRQRDIMINVGLEHLARKGYIEGKQRVTDITNLWKWMEEQGENRIVKEKKILRATKNMKLGTWHIEQSPTYHYWCSWNSGENIIQNTRKIITWGIIKIILTKSVLNSPRTDENAGDWEDLRSPGLQWKPCVTKFTS